MINLAHEICVQILKMEAVIDRVVDTQLLAQLKLYITICTEF